MQSHSRPALYALGEELQHRMCGVGVRFRVRVSKVRIRVSNVRVSVTVSLGLALHAMRTDQISCLTFKKWAWHLNAACKQTSRTCS